MAVLFLCTALAPTAAGAEPGQSQGRARDCTTEAMLASGKPSVVHYVVWCGVQSGRVTLRIRRPKSPPVLDFAHTARATGPGAAGPMRCHQRSMGRVFCSAQKSGPVTFRGSVTVASGTRCAARLSLNVWRWTGDSLDFPSGCPKSYEEPVRRLKQIIGDRTAEGLDLDLAGDRAAIARRARGLLAAWKRGEPVARWTYEEEAFRMPLRAQDQIELEYRDLYRERFQDLVEEGDWVARNAPDTYAGYEIDDAAGGIIYVGFTAEPEETLAKLERHLIAPERFLPFPVPPTHTEAELEGILESFISTRGPLLSLINSAGIDYLANKVELGTQHVARLRHLIDLKYGPDAPFKVVFEWPFVLL